MIMEPSILRHYGFGANVSKRDPIGTFLLRLVKNATTITSSSDDRPLSSMPPLKPCSDQAKATVMEIKDLKQTIAIKTSYGKTNVWLKWIKYYVLTLNKSDHYTCETGRPELQVVPFTLGWTSDSAEIKCITTIYQERVALGNESCMTLSLLFLVVKDPRGQKLPWWIYTPLPKLLTTPSASQQGGRN
jgi:hypothetical protein